MAKKKSISVHLTDEERAAFTEAMAKDHMVDLGPWIAKVVREYIAENAGVPDFQTVEQRLAYVEQLFENVKKQIEDAKKSQQK
jgi:hypothetical protein